MPLPTSRARGNSCSSRASLHRHGDFHAPPSRAALAAPCRLRHRPAPTPRAPTVAHLPPLPPDSPPAAGAVAQRRRLPDLPGRQRLEPRRERRPGGRELGRAARRDVAGQRAPSRPRHDRGVLRHSLHRRARPASRWCRSTYGTDGADYSDESDPGPMPIPRDAPIEGGSTTDPNPASGDRHVLVVQQGDCVLYELYNAVRTASGFRVSSSARWDLKVNATRPAGWTSADAAGLPILPGLLQARRGGGGGDHPRAPFHRPARAARLRGAGQPLRPVRGRLPAALRHPRAAPRGLLARAVHGRRAGDPHRAQDATA